MKLKFIETQHRNFVYTNVSAQLYKSWENIARLLIARKKSKISCKFHVFFSANFGFHPAFMIFGRFEGWNERWNAKLNETQQRNFVSTVMLAWEKPSWGSWLLFTRWPNGYPTPLLKQGYDIIFLFIFKKTILGSLDISHSKYIYEKCKPILHYKY